MTHSPQSSLLLPVLQQVSTDRLQKAVTALVDGSLTITLTRQTDAEIRALVRNGDGAEYGVTLTETIAACSCKDALYRGSICKHSVAVALHVLRTSERAPQQTVPVGVGAPQSHLAWTNGTVLCHTPHAAHVNVWPWSAPTLADACPDCVTIYQRGYNTSHMIHLVA